MAKSRWELEAERKKKAQQQALAAAQQAIKSGTAYKGNAVTDTVKKAAAASTAKKTSTTPKASTVTVSKPQGENIPTFLQGSGRTTAEKVSTPKQQNGFSSLQTLAEMPKTVQSIGNSVLQTSNDMRNLQRNSLLWHGTTDANERARLKSENDAIRKRLGLSYDNGNTYNPRTGQNLSQMTDMLYGSSAATRANTATQYAANQLPQILSQQASVRSQEDEEKGIAERVMETIEASTKRVRAGLDNWFATGNIAADEEAEQKFLAGEELGWLDQLRMKERWGENWESYLSGVRDAYQTGNTAIIEDYEQRARALNNLYDTTSLFDEAAQQAEAAKAGLSTAGKTALDALGMGADMLGAASIASTGGGGAGLFTGVSSVSAAGQAADQARRMGANAAQQEDYGNAVGALNFAVERLGGIGGGQAAAKIANRMLPEAVKNAAGKVTSTAVGRVLAGGAEEGLEGALQSEGERALRNVILDANERFDPAKFGVDIGYNALMGSLFRGGQEVAGTVLGGMRQGQTGNAAAQQAQQTNDTTTVSSSGFLLPEAKRQRMAAQDAAYAAQIDDVFRGNMPTDRAVSIGDTPDILLSIGATDLPMTMKQSTARKIAFPAGYMGGAHNLGVPALKRLPEQLRDPAAVLRSKTQPDSFVVLTEWNDTNGNPVIIALHLDKQGVVDVTNEVASAYGKNNFAALTGENGENVLYTKNNKSIDQILDDRLQLPALLSDDTLVAYSIAQQAEKSNAEQETQALGRRLAELDAQKRQAEGLLPGPIRDRAIAEAEQAMQEVQQQATQTGAQQTTSDPGAQVPASEAMQYGKTPELAMMEARERARNAAAQAARQSERKEIVSVLSQAWNEKRAAELQAEQTLNGLTLTQHDIEMAQNAARTGMDSQNWEQADNPEKAYIYGKALRDVREADQPIRQFFAQRAAALESEAQKAADAIATHAKDKRWGAAYQRETMERNIRDIFGKSHQQEAEAIIREYITPVHQAVAEGNRLKNNLRDRVKELKLNKHESALTQMRLEGEDGAAAEYIKNNNITVTPAMDAKISRAVQEFRNIYNELYNQINETLLLNGQEPAPFRKNYAPHFTKDKPDTLLGRVRFALGLGKDSSLNVPTDIAGITDTFRPGKKWFGNLLQREGEITDYDAVAGFDQYIETAADVITLTESIQKLRALEDQVRYTLSDEGVKAKIDAIRANRDLDALQQRQQIEEVYDTNHTTVQQLIDDLRNQQSMGMGRFVTELRRYTDNLAGKKSREDRGWEDMANRQVYQLAKSLEGRVAANMISLNPGSWLTNVIPITQATGEVSVPNLLRGMYQTVKGTVKDDGYRDASAFLTNRYGSERLDKTIVDRLSDLTGAPMELIDHFTANTIHRARYAQNINDGMSIDAAIADADAYTASLMADRSKGALPTAFNATNPVRKVFTMFQTEVNNQLSYLFKDMPKAQREKGVAAVAWAYTKVFGTAYLFNIAYSALTGRDAALDPIGMIADALGIGDDEDEEKTAAERVTGLVEDIGGQIPFVGGVLFDGGRVPISSAIPNFANLGKAAMPGLFGVEWSSEKRAQTAAKELAKPLTYLLPRFGGGAIKRGIEGFATVNAGGSYTYDNKGNIQLQFPAYGQKPLDYAQAILFGKWSSDEAQKYIDSGFKGLSADETRIYNGLRDDFGVEPNKAMDAVLSLRGFKSLENDEGKTIQTVKEQQRRALFDNAELTPEQKQWVDQELLVDPDSDQMPADYTDYTSFVLSMYDSEDRREAAEQAVQHGLTVDQFVQWDDRLKAVSSMKDRFDKNRYSDAEARSMVLDEVMKEETLSDSEKQAVADYVLISSMDSDTQKELWKTVAKGKVNASDFLRFKSDISAYEEDAKGTGTNNMENVATILRGYDELTDEQRDILFQTYNETMSNNPFHVSAYERAIMDNSLYQSLTDEGKAALRALTNEYEQHINEGRELNEWRAKAYMAEKEAGIAPGIYALYRTVLQSVDAQNDDNNYLSQDEAEIAINAIPGLTQYQKAYIWQSMSPKWKKNPFGSATVTEYQSGVQKAINPVAGGTLSSSFGPRTSPTAGASSWHKAVDIAAPEGTPVQAVKSGKVTSSGWVNGYGWTVHIDHGDGTETEYHHMQAQSSLQAGDTVEQGQQIGAVGSTGISTGPHLDLQAWQDGQIVDPLTIIPEYGGPSGYVYSGSSAASLISSGIAAAEKEDALSTGLKSLKGLKGFKSLPTF